MWLAMIATAALQTQLVPQFDQVPVPEDLRRAYPKDALLWRTRGHVTLRCEVQEAGGLARCRVLEETPKRAGFGEAALRLVPAFHLSPKAAGSDGRFRRGTIVVPIRFEPPPPPAPTSPEAAVPPPG